MNARLRSLVVLVLLALLPAPGVLAAPGPRGQADPAPDRAAEVVTLRVDDLRPRDPRPGEALQVVGVVTNRGDRDLTGVQVRLRVGDRLSTRGQLRLADASPPDTDERETQDLPDLPARASARLDVRVPVDELELGDDGVYPLQVQVRAYDDRGTGRRRQVGAVSTYLPWFGGDGSSVDPLRVAWLWPLVDAPRRSPREVMLDDELARSLAPRGRLGTSLATARTGERGRCAAGPQPPGGPPVTARPGAACAPVPVTYVVDPDLLFDVEAMTRDYPVATGRGRTRPGAGTPAARAWLAELRAATAGTDVVALPFADPDVLALSRRTATTGDVAVARAYGERVARSVLGREPLPDVAVPPPGPLGEPALDAVGAGSTRAVVLGPQALADPVDDPGFTQGTRVRLPPGPTSGPLTGLVVEQGLSELLTPPDVGGSGRRLAEQRWLVETAMIAAERPSRGRTLVVTAPRRGAGDPARGSPGRAGTRRVPWLCPVALADVVADRERCPGARTPSYAPERDAVLARPDADTPQLDARDLALLRQVREAGGQFTGSVLRPATAQSLATRSRMQRAWMRAQSSAWREQRAGAVRQVRLLRADVLELRGRVKVLTSPTTLTSRNGRVSVAVVNELDQPVTVQVQLRAPNEARLSTRGPVGEEGVLEVAPRSSQPVEFDARTSTSGRFLVQAQLLDRDGRPVGLPQELLVRSTRYGTVALAVTGLGAVVLFAAAGLRLVRRALRHRRGPAT